MIMVIDCVTYNGEYELFNLRYNILKDYVDEFIVVEFDKTFSGKNKHFWFYMPGTEMVFRNPGDEIPIHYFPVKEEQYIKYKDLAESSPNTIGAEHWKREFMQKESIKDCLTHLKDDDIVFIGDCDEVWDPEILKFELEGLKKLRLRVYTYWLNNYSSEVFNGTLMCHYKDIKNNCLNHVRSDSYKTLTEQGWHFTSLKDNLRQKLTDSYTEESYATKEVMDNLEENIKGNKDFLGRNFTFRIEEIDWPIYLKENRDKYLHLLR